MHRLDLPQDIRSTYLDLSQQLQILQDVLNSANPDPKALHTQFSQLKQLFQQKIIGLDFDRLTVEARSQLIPIQTELCKQMRLLSMDVLFLQTAQQPATVQNRLQEMLDRVTLLVHYCTMIFEEAQ